MAILRILHATSRQPGATDDTAYGDGRASPKSFLTHHTAHISTAIQHADAMTILDAAAIRAIRLSLAPTTTHA